ncbi:amino acid permease [Mycolicibacterium aubagnense]|uniref:Aromatic amino acid transporter AroP n=1 Tax=Mycolicibacterium aubagnense TaxID=319707 RepID=A0ABN5YW06_9MYCO|nr:amino acid permease [Mycolicibacterium aubagnense]WGI32943.1 amino acid permease [Mycolicibacterium aubagnense]BBX85380.1 aromatic amino acid transporter AroP [Mycolicibacterium aubagnense]
MTPSTRRAEGPPAQTADGTLDSGMHRKLKNRHLQMISLGSAIGTGLFLVSGTSVQTAGPIVLVGYAIAGIVLYGVMRMLGEMAVAHPVPGSWSAYAREYLGKPAGFIAGWNWWYVCIVVCMVELTAASEFMAFWFPQLPHWITTAGCLALITAANMINVKAFGEFEFYFTLIKVTAVLAMIGLGIAIIFGAGDYNVHGMENLWAHGGFAPKGLGAFMISLVAITFSFGGIESLGTAAGEVEEPARNIPRAINQVLLRILVFYVGAIGVMLIIWPWDKVGTDGSPFVLMLVGLGIGGAATLLNIVVLTAALSVANVMTYSNARVLSDLAASGQAPRFLAHTNERGVPVRALLINSGFVAVAVILNVALPGKALAILIPVVVGAELITWSIIALSHLRFRAREGAGVFKTPLSPITNYLCLAYFALIYLLMTQDPSSHSGAIALPVWFCGLLAVGFLLNRVTR